MCSQVMHNPARALYRLCLRVADCSRQWKPPPSTQTACRTPRSSPRLCSPAHGTSPISFLTSSVHWGPVLQVSRIVTRTGLAVAGLAGELGERVHGKHLEQPPAPARQAPHGGRGLLEPSVRARAPLQVKDNPPCLRSPSKAGESHSC